MTIYFYKTKYGRFITTLKKKNFKKQLQQVEKEPVLFFREGISHILNVIVKIN